MIIKIPNMSDLEIHSLDIDQLCDLLVDIHAANGALEKLERRIQCEIEKQEKN